MAFQGVPKWSKGCPNGPKKNQKSAQERKRASKGTQRRPTNHKTIYTQTEYTQTPDPPPHSGRLVYIHIHIETYLCVYAILIYIYIHIYIKRYV